MNNEESTSMADQFSSVPMEETTQGPTLNPGALFVYTRVVGSCLFAISGCFLNIGAVWIIQKRNLLKNAHNYLLTYLCVIELVFCLFVLPVFVYDQWTMQSLGNELYCKVYVLATRVLSGNIPLAMMCIALNRLALSRPQAVYGKPTWKTFTLLIVASNIAFIAITIPPLFNIGTVFAKSPVTGICTSLSSPDTFVYNTLVVVGFIAIPICVISVCYGLILTNIRRQNLLIGVAGNLDSVLQQADVQQGMRRRQHMIRVTLISAVTVAVYLLTYLPYLIGMLIPTASSNMGYVAISGLLTVSHTVTCPLFYILGDTQHLMTLRRVLGLVVPEETPVDIPLATVRQIRVSERDGITPPPPVTVDISTIDMADITELYSE